MSLRLGRRHAASTSWASSMTVAIPVVRSFCNEARRSYAVTYKRERVEKIMATPAALARMTHAHDLNQNQLSRWRRAYDQGKCATMGPSG